MVCLCSCTCSPDSQLKRRHVLVVQLVDVGAVLQQDLHDLLPAAADRVVQRCRVPKVTVVF